MHLKKRQKRPLQDVTIPPQAVCGFGASSGPSAYPYEKPNGQPITQVDPIQVGPTG